jgi:hypothetical protein
MATLNQSLNPNQVQEVSAGVGKDKKVDVTVVSWATWVTWEDMERRQQIPAMTIAIPQVNFVTSEFVGSLMY